MSLLIYFSIIVNIITLTIIIIASIPTKKSEEEKILYNALPRTKPQEINNTAQMIAILNSDRIFYKRRLKHLDKLIKRYEIEFDRLNGR